MDHSQIIAGEFSIKQEYAQNIINLLDEGNTIPFIARYRKEMHGTLDDQTIRAISERLEYLRGLDKRREEVYALIEGQEKMTDEIAASLAKAETLAELEDIYRPFRPKRKTRASVAKEKGLEPLADFIFAQSGSDLEQEAEKYISEEKGVENTEAAIQGAMDIIAESISDDPEIRKRLKNIIRLNAVLRTKASDPDTDSVYRNYYDYSEPVSKIAGHRLLAINRGEREGFIKVTVDIPPEKCTNIMERLKVTGSGELSGKDSASSIPWDALRGQIKKAMIGSGIETIKGANFFSNCPELTTVVFPTSLTYIGANTFKDVTNMPTVYYCGTEDQWAGVKNNSAALTADVLQYHVTRNPAGNISATCSGNSGKN